VPHKEFAFNLCDKLDNFAQKIGAVNTLVKKNNLIYGYNTDAPGFYKAIESFGKLNTILVLGAGGTAKAVATVLKEKGLHVEVLNRSENRLEYFRNNNIDAYCWDTFTLKNYDLIVNTTLAGLVENTFPLDKILLNTLFSKAQFAFDVIYNKNTPFLQLAKENNLTCKDGSNMLLHQGVLAFNLFFGNKLDNFKIEKYMREAFKL
jgi:shikimate dehydrogenase